MIKKGKLYKFARSIYHHMRWKRRIQSERKVNEVRWGKQYADINLQCEIALQNAPDSDMAQTCVEQKTDYIRAVLVDLLNQ